MKETLKALTYNKNTDYLYANTLCNQIDKRKSKEDAENERLDTLSENMWKRYATDYDDEYINELIEEEILWGEDSSIWEN